MRCEARFYEVTAAMNSAHNGWYASYWHDLGDDDEPGPSFTEEEFFGPGVQGFERAMGVVMGHGFVCPYGQSST